MATTLDFIMPVFNHAAAPMLANRTAPPAPKLPRCQVLEIMFSALALAPGVGRRHAAPAIDPGSPPGLCGGHATHTPESAGTQRFACARVLRHPRLSGGGAVAARLPGRRTRLWTRAIERFCRPTWSAGRARTAPRLVGEPGSAAPLGLVSAACRGSDRSVAGLRPARGPLVEGRHRGLGAAALARWSLPQKQPPECDECIRVAAPAESDHPGARGSQGSCGARRRQSTPGARVRRRTAGHAGCGTAPMVGPAGGAEGGADRLATHPALTVEPEALAAGFEKLAHTDSARPH